MENKVTREEMLIVINNHLYLVAETIIKTSDIVLDESYVVLSNWNDDDLEDSNLLLLTGRVILDGYTKKGKQVCIEHIQILEMVEHKDFVEKFYKAIKNKNGTKN